MICWTSVGLKGLKRPEPIKTGPLESDFKSISGAIGEFCDRR